MRVALYRDKFKRRYTQNYSEEIFKVVARIPSSPERFKIQDLAGEPVAGSFYAQELKAVNAHDISQINWKIERVISTRKIKSRKYSLIKWFGYPKKFNTLVPSSDLPKYSRRR